MTQPTSQGLAVGQKLGVYILGYHLSYLQYKEHRIHFQLRTVKTPGFSQRKNGKLEALNTKVGNESGKTAGNNAKRKFQSDMERTMTIKRTHEHLKDY